jgi:hypothetical protein
MTTANAQDIGHGVTVELRAVGGETLGAQYTHPAPTGDRHEGWIPFGSDGWTVEKAEPLTISPSLLCRACGHHGFIREGRWVPA